MSSALHLVHLFYPVFRCLISISLMKPFICLKIKKKLLYQNPNILIVEFTYTLSLSNEDFGGIKQKI